MKSKNLKDYLEVLVYNLKKKITKLRENKKQ